MESVREEHASAREEHASAREEHASARRHLVDTSNKEAFPGS